MKAEGNKWIGERTEVKADKGRTKVKGIKKAYIKSGKAEWVKIKWKEMIKNSGLHIYEGPPWSTLDCINWHLIHILINHFIHHPIPRLYNTSNLATTNCSRQRKTFPFASTFLFVIVFFFGWCVFSFSHKCNNNITLYLNLKKSHMCFFFIPFLVHLFCIISHKSFFLDFFILLDFLFLLLFLVFLHIFISTLIFSFLLLNFISKIPQFCVSSV